MTESGWQLENNQVTQSHLFVAGSPAQTFAEDSGKRALDELFNATVTYRESNQFKQLLEFITRFRSLAPYNAMLVQLQRPGAVYVAFPRVWLEKYDRRIKPGANPLVVLQTFGPVGFVFDVSDTEPAKTMLYPTDLPPEIEKPFEVSSQCDVSVQLERTIQNAKRDGVRLVLQPAGSQAAGCIAVNSLSKDEPAFELVLSSKLSPQAQYATLVHELAHLYCGHLGTPNPSWWPDRRGLGKKIVEFEAESVAYIVCSRLGLDCPSAQYLSGYLGKNNEVPPVSLECVLKAAGLIERMGREKLRARKKDE